MSHSRGSLFEVETDLIIASRVGFVKAETFRAFCERTDEIGKMLNGLIDSVAASAGRAGSRHH